MDPVSLGLGALSAADLCIKYGRLLVSKCRDYKNADAEITELLLCIENHWVKLEIQIDILRKIWNELGATLQIHQNSILQHLQYKLQKATALIDSAIGNPDVEASIKTVIRKKGRVHKGAFALTLKECLNTAIHDLDQWHARFDPSWFLITRISNSNVDHQLADQRASQSDTVSAVRRLRGELKGNSDGAVIRQTSIFIPASDVSSERWPVPFSAVELSMMQKTREVVIVNRVISHEQADKVTTTRAIRNLARVLSKVRPLTFGLLACRGVIQGLDPFEEIPTFEIVFDIPAGLMSATSLRSLLLAANERYPLDERVSLAKQLAKSVSYVHTAQFVHKNIRPETILLFEKGNSTLGVPFLVGFENFRLADGATYLAGDSFWERDIYRHPLRQGLRPDEEYKMQHDIYSLGVCLLEIGLWISFVTWIAGAKSPVPHPELHVANTLQMKDQRKKAFEIKSILVDIAKDRLPSQMGRRYTVIVVSCLTCLDRDNEEFGDEDFFLDEDGIEVGVRYIEKVVPSRDSSPWAFAERCLKGSA